MLAEHQMASEMFCSAFSWPLILCKSVVEWLVMAMKHSELATLSSIASSSTNACDIAVDESETGSLRSLAIINSFFKHPDNAYFVSNLLAPF